MAELVKIQKLYSKLNVRTSVYLFAMFYFVDIELAVNKKVMITWATHMMAEEVSK